MEAYERRLKAHIREQVVPLRKRLLGLEETLEERTASLERTIEERSNRIHRLKRAWTSATEELKALEAARWRRRIRRWLDFVVKIGIPKN